MADQPQDQLTSGAIARLRMIEQIGRDLDQLVSAPLIDLFARLRLDFVDKFHC
jgi:hypothetical protein